MKKTKPIDCWQVVFKVESYGKKIIRAPSKEQALELLNLSNVRTLLKDAKVHKVMNLGAYKKGD